MAAYVDLNTKFRKSAIWAGVSVERSARLGSLSSFCSGASTADKSYAKVLTRDTLPTKTRRTRCFQVGNYATITPSKKTLGFEPGILLGRGHYYLACVSQKTRKLLGPENGPVKPQKNVEPEKYVIFCRKLCGYSLPPEKRFRLSFLVRN